MVHTKNNVSDTWSPSKLRLTVGDAHTKMSDKETSFESPILHATEAPTDRNKQVTFYMHKCVKFGTWNIGQTLETN